MTPWIYDDTPPPVAYVGRANGTDSVMLDMPDGSDHSDQGEAGSGDFDGPSMIWQGPGSKDMALRWLREAIRSVEALPDPDHAG